MAWNGPPKELGEEKWWCVARSRWADAKSLPGAGETRKNEPEHMVKAIKTLKKRLESQGNNIWKLKKKAGRILTVNYIIKVFLYPKNYLDRVYEYALQQFMNKLFWC